MKVYDIRRSGNILIVWYEDEERNIIKKDYILGQNHFVSLYSDYTDYARDNRVENGEFAMAVLLDAASSDYYVSELVYGYHRNAVMLFAGDEEAVVKKKLRPFIAKKKSVDRKLKVIDFKVRDRQLVLYLGKPETKDYWGDDWNDRPYEHNAGTVYDEFVEDTVVVNLPEDMLFVEACYRYLNSPWSKEDFTKGDIPFAYICKEDDMSETYRGHKSVKDICQKELYFEMPVAEFYRAGWKITEE